MKEEKFCPIRESGHCWKDKCRWWVARYTAEYGYVHDCAVVTINGVLRDMKRGE